MFNSSVICPLITLSAFFLYTAAVQAAGLDSYGSSGTPRFFLTNFFNAVCLNKFFITYVLINPPL